MVPANYIAFRYDGRLQRIHHVERAEMVQQPNDHFAEAPREQAGEGSYFLYELGPAFGTDLQLKYGRKYRAGTFWCMLDTLFTSKTLAEAVDVTHERRG